MAEVMTTEEIKVYWDNFKESYESELETGLVCFSESFSPDDQLPVARSLYSSLGLEAFEHIGLRLSNGTVRKTPRFSKLVAVQVGIV